MLFPFPSSARLECALRIKRRWESQSEVEWDRREEREEREATRTHEASSLQLIVFSRNREAMTKSGSYVSLIVNMRCKPLEVRNGREKSEVSVRTRRRDTLKKKTDRMTRSLSGRGSFRRIGLEEKLDEILGCGKRGSQRHQVSRVERTEEAREPQRKSRIGRTLLTRLLPPNSIELDVSSKGLLHQLV